MPDHAAEIAALRGPQTDAQAIEALVHDIQGLRALGALHLVTFAAGAQPVREDTVGPYEPDRVRQRILAALRGITDPTQLSLLRIGAQVIATIDRNAHRGALS